MNGKRDTSRLFIAVPACDEIKSAALELRRLNGDLIGTRWIPIENLHVTILFLGEVEDQIIPGINSALNVGIHLASHIELIFDRFSLEGGRASRPSMVWARFHRNDDFSGLSHRLVELLGELTGASQHFAEPVPHITLARIRSQPAPRIEINAQCKIVFTGLELWKTHRTAGGVQYEVVAQYKF